MIPLPSMPDREQIPICLQAISAFSKPEVPAILGCGDPPMWPLPAHPHCCSHYNQIPLAEDIVNNNQLLLPCSIPVATSHPVAQRKSIFPARDAYTVYSARDVPKKRTQGFNFQISAELNM